MTSQGLPTIFDYLLNPRDRVSKSDPILKSSSTKRGKPRQKATLSPVVTTPASSAPSSSPDACIPPQSSKAEGLRGAPIVLQTSNLAPKPPMQQGAFLSPIPVVGTNYTSPVAPSSQQMKRGPAHLRFAHKTAEREGAEQREGFAQFCHANKEQDGQTSYFVEINDSNFSDAALSDLVEFLDKEIPRVHAQHCGPPQFEGEPASGSPQFASTRLGVRIFLAANEIGDASIAPLCQMLIRHNPIIHVVGLWMYKNKIGDEGAKEIANLLTKLSCPIREIHLSHNQIAAPGALALVNAAMSCGKYPYLFDTKNGGKKKEKLPLWLRLEFNCINVDVFSKSIKQNNICFSTERKCCGPTKCRHSGDGSRKVHLFAFKFQYQPWGENKFLIGAKTSLKPASIAPITPTVQPTTAAAVAAASAPEIDDQPPQTFFFLDTNAVLSMAEDPTQSLFNFEMLLAKSSLRSFGCVSPLKPEDKVMIVIVDTVMQELEHLKKTKPYLKNQIKRLQHEDDGLLVRAQQAGFLVMLGAHQGELLVEKTDRQVVAAAKTAEASLRNDRRIIDVAVFWDTEIGESGHVFLITGDQEAKRTAKLHSLPSESLGALNQNLIAHCAFASERGSDLIWSAPLLKSCIPDAVSRPDGQKIDAPIAAVRRSLYAELERGSDVIAKLVTIVKQSNDAQTAEVLRTAESIISDWGEVLKRKPVQLTAAGGHSGTSAQDQAIVPDLNAQ